MITSILIISLILLLWFKTDVFVEYASLFGLGKVIKAPEYQDSKLTEVSSYPLFLKTNYKGFFFRLIGCPICLAVWLSIIISIAPSISCFLEYITITDVLYILIAIPLTLWYFFGYVATTTLVSLLIFGVLQKLFK